MHYGMRIEALRDRLNHDMQKFEEMRREHRPTSSHWLILSYYVNTVWRTLVVGPCKEIIAWGRERKERLGFKLVGIHDLRFNKKYPVDDVFLWMGAMFRFRTIKIGRDKDKNPIQVKIVTPVSSFEYLETEPVTPKEAYEIHVRLRQAEMYLLQCDKIYRMFDWIKSRNNDKVNDELYWAILVSLTAMLRALHPEHLDAVEYMKAKSEEFKCDWISLANIRNCRVGHINYKMKIEIKTLDEWWELLSRLLPQRKNALSVVGVATLMAHAWDHRYADELKEWDRLQGSTIDGS